VKKKKSLNQNNEKNEKEKKNPKQRNDHPRKNTFKTE